MSNDEKTKNPRERDARLTIYRCDEGHAFFYSHRDCPVCGKATRETSSPPEAKLISHTVVRVSPTGQQSHLGLAETEGGAKTLCIIDEGVDADRGDVIVYLKGGLYHARPGYQER
jgi:uncharacterized OB-fold protein